MDPLKLRARVAIGGMLALGLFALVWRARANQQAALDASPVEQGAEGPSGAPDPGEVDRPVSDMPPPTPAETPRVQIPKPAPAAEDTLAPTPSDAPADAERLDDEQGEPLDSAPQGGADPDLPLTPETLMEVADAMHPEINDCVNEWAPVLPPELQGRLVLAFTLDEQGVDEAWVDEVEDLPAGVLGCFSTAVYNQTWPAAEGGVQVTLPFEVDMGDGGVPEGEGEGLRDRRGE